MGGGGALILDTGMLKSAGGRPVSTAMACSYLARATPQIGALRLRAGQLGLRQT